MSHWNDPTYAKIHRLVMDWLEDNRRDQVQEKLSALLCDSEEARRVYQEYMQESAGLRWRTMQSPGTLAEIESFAGASTTTPPNVDRRRLFRGLTPLTLAASILSILAVYYFAGFPKGDDLALMVEDAGPNSVAIGALDSPPKREANGVVASSRSAGPEVATLSRVIGARWHERGHKHQALSRLRCSQELWIEEGQAEIVFDSGVEIVVKGPSHLRIESGTRALSEYGTFSARVGPEGHGFTICTPSAEVVDLGTEFGLAINKQGESEVAVFNGIVDVSYSNDKKPTATSQRRRLSQGEALRISRKGETTRVVSINYDRFPIAGSLRDSRNLPPPVISNVTDTLRDGKSSKFYRIVRAGLREDTTAFVDRSHQWNGVDASGIPKFLVGADYVMPFNDDKFVRTIDVRVDIASPAILYILIDENMDVPDWLRRDFQKTDAKIGLDKGESVWDPFETLAEGPGNDIGNTFSIWKREVSQPGVVVLGAVEKPDEKLRGYNMYGIAATRLDEPPSDLAVWSGTTPEIASYMPVVAKWKPVWSDEFDAPGPINPEIWRFEEGLVRNRELQYYTARRQQNARVENGALILEARSEQISNPQFSLEPTNWRHRRPTSQYTSASVTTNREMDILYGRIDVRAKLPAGRGVWPAIWLLGRNYEDIGWPECGELDIMEHVGYMPNTVWSAVHTEKYNWQKKNQKKGLLTLENASESFHTYSVHWFPDRLECFVDGECHFTHFKNEGENEVWPFDRPFQLILNLAIGGDLGGKHGVDGSIFPQRFVIDYVRVFEAESL